MTTEILQTGSSMEYMVNYRLCVCTLLESSIFLSLLAIRVDFSGKKGYTVSEQDEYLEVCIRLVSTGSHEELLSSVEVIVTYEDQSTTGMKHWS